MALRTQFKVTRLRSNNQRVVRFFKKRDDSVLLKQGAYVRGVARQSISRKKQVSQPGKPPRSPTGILKNTIYFAALPVDKSVVVGPIRTKHFKAPKALEFGGVSKFLSRRGGGFARAGFQRVRARPFMRPALRRAIDRGLFRQAMKQVYSRRRN